MSGIKLPKFTVIPQDTRSSRELVISSNVCTELSLSYLESLDETEWNQQLKNAICILKYRDKCSTDAYAARVSIDGYEKTQQKKSFTIVIFLHVARVMVAPATWATDFPICRAERTNR